MVSRIDSINITAHSPEQLGAFWQQVLGLGEDPDNPNLPGDEEFLYTTEPISITLLFQPLSEGRQAITKDTGPVVINQDDELQPLDCRFH